MNLNSDHLKQFIDENRIEAEIVHLTVDTPTVADAAAAVNVQPAQIIKSVLFMADGRPVLVITNGLTRISYKRLADFLGLSRRRLKMANPGEVKAHTGYEVGAVAPFGHPTPLRTVLDTAVLQQPVVYGGGGEIHALMRLRTAELRRVLQPEIVDLARVSPP